MNNQNYEISETVYQSSRTSIYRADHKKENKKVIIKTLSKEYPSFKILLKYLSEENCLGCRKGSCLYPDCGVRDCYKDKNIDFCFQCDEFPCEKTNFDSHLKQRWIQINQRMKEIGIKAYYKETKDLPRY